MKRVIFLDIDGVLNNQSVLRAASRLDTISDQHVELVAHIVKETGAVLVLSSTWRLYRDLLRNAIRIFESHGLTLHDVTPAKISAKRHQEIQLWLDEHEGVEKFAIIDDDGDAEIAGNFFKTSFIGEGLTKEIAEQVIQHLNSR